MRLSPINELEGLIETLETLGGLFLIVRVVLTGAPASIPSKGVMVHFTLSPFTKFPARLSVVPTTVPPIDHSKVEESGSPSASEYPE